MPKCSLTRCSPRNRKRSLGPDTLAPLAMPSPFPPRLSLVRHKYSINCTCNPTHSDIELANLSLIQLVMTKSRSEASARSRLEHA